MLLRRCLYENGIYGYFRLKTESGAAAAVMKPEASELLRTLRAGLTTFFSNWGNDNSSGHLTESLHVDLSNVLDEKMRTEEVDQ